jgi:TonB-dependent heme/hemoglobin receptor
MASRIKGRCSILRRFAWRAIGATALSACVTQSPAQDSVTLDPITVTGPKDSRPKGYQGTPDWVYETPASVSVLTREQIEQRSPRNTSDLFRDMPGVFTAGDRQNPGLTVNIRGLQEQGRVNVMIDGARQNFQQAGHDAVSFVYVDPELIGSAVVEKGPTSTVGGAGVIGGVVSLRTLEADDILLPGRNYGMRSRLTAGTNKYGYTTSQAAATRNEKYEFVAAVSRKESGAYKPGQNGVLEFVGPGEPVVFTGQHNWSGLAKLALMPTTEQRLKLGYVALNNAFSTGEGEYIDTNKLFTQTATADYSWKPSSQWIDLNAKAWWSSTDNRQFRPARTTYGFFDLQYGLTSFGGSLANTSRFEVPLFNVAWAYGAEYFQDRTNTGVMSNQRNANDAEWFSGPTPAGQRSLSSAFTEMKLKHGEWLELIAGGRYDLYALHGSGVFLNNRDDGGGGVEQFRQDFSVEKSEGRFSPKFTAAVTPVKGFQFYGTYAEGFRPPQIMETLQYGTHIGGGLVFAPNPNLKPETSKTVEGGINLKYDNVFIDGDGFRGKASIFKTRIENFITTATGRYPQAGNDPGAGLEAFVRVNLLGPTTVSKGYELEASYDAGKAFIGASYTRLSFTYDGVFDPFFAGPPNGTAYLPFLSQWERDYFFLFVPPKEKYTLDGGVRFLDRKITIGARVTYVAPTNPITNQEVMKTYKLYGYHLYGGYFTAELNEHLTARLSVDNLFDKAYVDAMGNANYPAPGRTVTFQLQGKF